MIPMAAIFLFSAVAVAIWPRSCGMTGSDCASGPRAVYLAFGIGRCGVDLGGADGLYAGRDRLAKSATDMAAQERRLSQIKYGTMDFRAPQITEFMILSFAWTRLATLCLMT